MSTDDKSYFATFEIIAERFPIGGLNTERVREFFVYSLANILPKIVFSKDMEKFLDTIVVEEGAFPRSTLFTDVFATASYLFKDCRSPSLSEWADPDSRYEIVADPPCNLALQSIVALNKKTSEAKELGEGEAPEGLFDDPAMKHSKQRVLSVINTELWDNAGWTGVAVGFTPDMPPILGLMFRNGDVGKQIFLEWRSEVGRTDDAERIRVTILTGVDKDHASSYTLMISSNIDNVSMEPLDRVYMMSRSNVIDNPNPENLNGFRREFDWKKRYFLAPVVIDESMSNPEFLMDHAILKRSIQIREAWTVGPNDPDCMAVRPDTDPFIPDDQPNPPILRLLELRRKMRS